MRTAEKLISKIRLSGKNQQIVNKLYFLGDQECSKRDFETGTNLKILIKRVISGRIINFFKLQVDILFCFDMVIISLFLQI